MKYGNNIEEVNLNSQNLSEIPKEIFSLVNLKKLYLYDNKISNIPRKSISVFMGIKISWPLK